MKRYIIVTCILVGILLTGCASPTPNQTSLPELFSYAPAGADQILHMQIDEGIIDILSKQYGAETPVVDEFRNIDELMIWQQGDQVSGKTLLLISGDEVDISQLAVLGLVVGDDSYGSTTIADGVQAYGQDTILRSEVFSGVDQDALTQQVNDLFAQQSEANFAFLSRPGQVQLPGLAGQFSQSLQGTVGLFTIGDQMPTGEARMLFAAGIVPKLSGTRQPTQTPEQAPIHISAHNLSTVLSIPKTLLEKMLPLVAPQYIGDSAALLGPDDYSILFDALGGTVSLDLVPSILGMGGRLTVEDTKLADLIQKLSPALDGYFKTTLFSEADLQLQTSESDISRLTQLPVGTGANSAPVAIAGMSRGSDQTSLQFMNLTPLPELEAAETSLPASTFLVADIDFGLLSSILGDQMQLLPPQDTQKKLHLEVTAHHRDDMIQVVIQ